MQQRDAEWMAVRAGKWSASAAADLMAKTKSGPAAARANLVARIAVERLTGRQVEGGYRNAAMDRGIALEPEALAAYTFETGAAVEECAWAEHPTIANVGCSPDGLVGDDGLVEIKCPDAMARHLDALLSGEHAQTYRWQLQFQLFVTSRAWVDAGSYDPRWPTEHQLAIVRVQRDEKAIAEIVAEIAAAEREVETALARLRALRERKEAA